MNDPEQARLTLRVMELLDGSAAAHRAGDKATCGRLAEEAYALDGATVEALRGGIMIGEVPDPVNDHALWLVYLDNQRSHVAALAGGAG